MSAYSTPADIIPRCWRCARPLAEIVTVPWRIKCQRCKATNQRGDFPEDTLKRVRSMQQTKRAPVAPLTSS